MVNPNIDQGWMTRGQECQNTEDESFEDGAGVLEEIGIIQDGEIIGKWHFYDPWLLEGFGEGWSGDHASWKLYYDPEFKITFKYKPPYSKLPLLLFSKSVWIHYKNLEDVGFEEIISLAIVGPELPDPVIANWEACRLESMTPWQIGAYGTFLTGLEVIYLHDKIAEEATRAYNVTWTRTKPVMVSTGDHSPGTWISLECNHNMGVKAEGGNVKAFNYARTSAINPIEYYVMEALFPGSDPMGAPMTGIGQTLLQGAPVSILEGENYTIITDEHGRYLIIDHTTGIVRDILYNLMGAYCYYHQQTEWARELGLIVIEVRRFMDLPLMPLLAAVFPGEMYIVVAVSIIYHCGGSIEPLRGVLENLTFWRPVYGFDGWGVVKERIEHAKQIFFGAVTILVGLESGGWSRLANLIGGFDLLINGLREYEQWYNKEGYKYDDVLRLET